NTATIGHASRFCRSCCRRVLSRTAPIRLDAAAGHGEIVEGEGAPDRCCPPFPVPRSPFPPLDALPLLPERRHPRHRLARERGRGDDPPPAGVRGVRRAFQHAGDGGAEAADDHQERRAARPVRCAQAAPGLRPGAAEAAGVGGADRGGGARGRAPAAYEHRARDRIAAGRRVRDGGVAQARPRRLRAFRLGVPRVRGRGGLPRGTRPARARPPRRGPAPAAGRRDRPHRPPRRQKEALMPPSPESRVPSPRFSALDHAMMARALRLAERGAFTTKPNPMVGCVLVRDGEVVGEGWHERAGGPHAEVYALEGARERARGATAYVTLEPCSHTGKTGPCADALIAAGVARVVGAMRDPNPEVNGGGYERLRAAGIQVESGLMEAQARLLNRGFISRLERGRPRLRVQLATSLDGRSARASGESKWTSGGPARADVHRWRARAGALLTGAGTVLVDDPHLTVRLEKDVAGKDIPFVAPLRVVLDPGLATVARGHIREGAAPTLYLHA